jgi:hypothetical protein
MLSSYEEELLTLVSFLLMVYTAFILTAAIILLEDIIEYRLWRWLLH